MDQCKAGIEFLSAFLSFSKQLNLILFCLLYTYRLIIYAQVDKHSF